MATLFPGELLLDGLELGFHRQTMAIGTRAHRELIVWGVLAIAVVAALLSRLLGASGLRRVVARSAERALRATPRAWAIGAGVVAFGLALIFQRAVYEGLLTNPDEMISLIQARYLASGRLGGALEGDPAHWLMINSLVTPAGWVSQYPPGHLAVLALGVLLGVPLLVGPVCAGVAAALYARSFELLLPGRPAVARAGSALLALCPFTMIVGGQIVSHSTTMAAGAGALYASLRSRDAQSTSEAVRWGLAAGVAGAVMVAARPWTGVTVGTVLVLGPWLGSVPARSLLPRLGAVLVGGAPFGVLFLAYHRAVFGAATRLGYVVAFGSGHGVGFHVDPWGYEYTLRKAVAITSGDLAMLGFQIWESPLSPLLLVGAWLLIRPASVVPPIRFLLVWAVVTIPANLLYWFHAPRMYVESVPAWLLLAVVAAADLIGTVPDPGPRSESERDEVPARMGLLRGGVAWICALGLAAPAWFLGPRISTLSWSDEARARLHQPEGLPDAPSLVFVHTNWWDRIGRTLQADGMRGDSTEILLRLRDPCELWTYSRARRAALDAGSSLPEPPPLQQGLVGAPTASCRHEIDSDRLDVIALPPLQWQGDLPGLPPRGAMYVRDFGPERNRLLLEAYPDRVPLVFRADGTETPPVLVPYAEGMATLWP